MRAEVFCGGKLVRVTGWVEVPDYYGEPFPTPEAAREAKAEYLATHTVPLVDGESWWLYDGKPVTDTEAREMLAQAGEEYP